MTSTVMTLSKAINAGLRQAMTDDDRVILMGEDIGKLGGVYRITEGLQDTFGERRVMDTPLAESAILGTAVGLAYAGFRPVCEIQFDGFIYPAFDQIVSQVARMHARTAGAVKMPITIRVPFGGGIGAAEHHSDSPEAYFMHASGLRVVSVSNPQDAYTVIQEAIASNDPVLFFEPKRRYHVKGDVELESTGQGRNAMDTARVVSEGRDVTLISYGGLVQVAVEAAKVASTEGVSVEVIDLRSLAPIDFDAIANSVRKTGRVVIAHEAAQSGGLGAEIAAGHHGALLLLARTRTGSGHRVRHPVPALEAREVSPARPGPGARRSRPRARSPQFAQWSGDLMTVKEFALPDLGEGLTESEIVAWHVAEGDMVTLNQVLADVETAKAMVELPSPYAGRITRLHVAEGTTVPVGDAIISFEVDAAEPASTSPEPAPASAPDAAEPEQDAEHAPPNLVGYGALPDSAGQPVRRARNAPDGRHRRNSTEHETAPSMPSRAPQRLAAPPVRKLAESLGVDLAHVHGSGESGLITRSDVEAAAGDHSPAPKAQQQDGTTVPVAGIRKLTAEAVTRSAFTAPHVTVFLTVDVTRTVELLDELRSTPAFREGRLTFLAAVAKAVTSSMPSSPQVNSRWGDDGITRFDHVNLGIAAATPRGLLVPVVKDAHTLDLAGLAAALTQLARTAKAGETRPPDLAGGTFTITNVGVFGVDAGTPILNNGEAAILAVGAVAKRPWEWRGEVALRDVVTLSLSFDHRVLDGEQGSRFLSDVGRLLSNPASAFAL